MCEVLRTVLGIVSAQLTLAISMINIIKFWTYCNGRMACRDAVYGVCVCVCACVVFVLRLCVGQRGRGIAVACLALVGV